MYMYNVHTNIGFEVQCYNEQLSISNTMLQTVTKEQMVLLPLT